LKSEQGTYLAWTKKETLAKFKDNKNFKKTADFFSAVCLTKFKHAVRFYEDYELDTHFNIVGVNAFFYRCFTSRYDPEFERLETTVATCLSELEEAERTGTPGACAAGAHLAIRMLRTLLDVYRDWNKAGIDYLVEDEIDMSAMLGRIVIKYKKASFLAGNCASRIYHRLHEKLRIYKSHEEIWLEYFQQTPEERQTFLDQYANTKFPRITH
jgi:hypothetical protein